MNIMFVSISHELTQIYLILLHCHIIFLSHKLLIDTLILIHLCYQQSIDKPIIAGSIHCSLKIFLMITLTIGLTLAVCVMLNWSLLK